MRKTMEDTSVKIGAISTHRCCCVEKKKATVMLITLFYRCLWTKKHPELLKKKTTCLCLGMAARASRHEAPQRYRSTAWPSGVDSVSVREVSEPQESPPPGKADTLSDSSLTLMARVVSATWPASSIKPLHLFSECRPRHRVHAAKENPLCHPRQANVL